MTSHDPFTDLVHTLIDTLEESKIAYAFGGALALAASSEPRATADIDIVLWVSDENMDQAIQLIKKAGVKVDPSSALKQVKESGMFVGRAKQK